MSNRDLFHNVVRAALEKDGWIITDDPYHLDLGFTDFYIDLGAEKIIAATKDNQKIAVEIKSFVGTSTVSEFHMAVGQFINYRAALEQESPERLLYLAVPLNTYRTFFKTNFIQNIIQRYQISLLIYDVDKEEIWQWIK